MRKTGSLEAALPWLYLKGISTSEMQTALEALVGPEAKGLASSTVSRLEQRLPDGRQGSASGTKTAGSISGLMGSIAARLPAGSLDEVFSETRQQRCWMHKTGNVLNALPKAVQPKAKRALHDIWQAPTREDAEAAFDAFIDTYEPKYPKAVMTLVKDREVLMTSYDFPATHWQPLRTTNDRIDVCHDSASHGSRQGLRDPRQYAPHDLQTRRICRQELAQATRLGVPRQGR